MTDDASEIRFRLLFFWRSLNAPTVSARLQLWEHRCVGMCGLNGCIGWLWTICFNVVRSSASSICCAAILCHALPKMDAVGEQGSHRTVLPHVSNSPKLKCCSLSASVYGKSVLGCTRLSHGMKVCRLVAIS